MPRDKLIDCRFVEMERTAVHLTRLCYWVALGIEVEQPASALKLLEAAHDARFHLGDCTTPLTRQSVRHNVQRASAALRCVGAILARQRKDGKGPQSQVTAALEFVERLEAMLCDPPAADAGPASAAAD